LALGANPAVFGWIAKLRGQAEAGEKSILFAGPVKNSEEQFHA
jgi:hypothetical protein